MSLSRARNDDGQASNASRHPNWWPFLLNPPPAAPWRPRGAASRFCSAECRNRPAAEIFSAVGLLTPKNACMPARGPSNGSRGCSIHFCSRRQQWTPPWIGVCTISSMNPLGPYCPATSQRPLPFGDDIHGPVWSAVPPGLPFPEPAGLLPKRRSTVPRAAELEPTPLQAFPSLNAGSTTERPSAATLSARAY